MPEQTFSDLRSRFYEKYASTHAGNASFLAENRIVRRDIVAHLEGSQLHHPIVDVGCGQGGLVDSLGRHGFSNVTGIDVSPEQVRLAHEQGVKNVRLGDYREFLSSHEAELSAVIATDLLEHLMKAEVVEFFSLARDALRPRGVLIIRSPNGVSPFSGYFQFGDFTHETVLTPSSFRQLAKMSGFNRDAVYPCSPIPHGVTSLARLVVWKGASALMKIAIAAETGDRHTIVTQNFVGVATR